MSDQGEEIEVDAEVVDPVVADDPFTAASAPVLSSMRKMAARVVFNGALRAARRSMIPPAWRKWVDNTRTENERMVAAQTAAFAHVLWA